MQPVIDSAAVRTATMQESAEKREREMQSSVGGGGGEGELCNIPSHTQTNRAEAHQSHVHM